ncbi:thioredoxin family protein [Bacteroides oleiciplenus]
MTYYWSFRVFADKNSNFYSTKNHNLTNFFPSDIVEMTINHLKHIIMEEKKEAREERNREKLANADWIMAEFYATWCPHCKRMQPIVEEFKKSMEGTLEVVQVDIDQESALADFYTIEMYPTFILLRKGEQLWRQSGELPLERLEKAVKEFKS